MTMFIITDGNNNVSRDKPVEHIDMVIGFHVSACTSCTRTMRVRRDIAIDITESVQLLVRFNALRSMPVITLRERSGAPATHTYVVSRPSGRESGRLFHHPLVMESTVCTASMVLRDIASKRVVSVPAQRSPYYGQNNCRGHRWHAGR